MGFHGRGLDIGDISLKNVNFSHLPRLKEFMVPHMGRLVLSMILVTLVSLLALVNPLLVGRAIDVHIPERDTTGLLYTVGLYVLVLCVIGILRYSQTYIMSWVGQSILYSMRKKIFSHLQDLGLDFYDRLQAGRIMSRATNDVESINQLISSGILNLLSDLVTIGGIVIVMLRLNIRLALITYLTLPVLFFTIWSLRFRMTRAHHKVRRRIADVTANLQESISGMKIVQAFSREDVNADRFDDTNMQNFQANMEAARLQAIFAPLVEIIGALGIALVVYYGGLRMSWGDTTVTVGTIVIFITYVQRFFHPIRQLSEIYNLLLQAGVSSERYFEVIETRPNVEDKPHAIVLDRIKGHVRFQDVVFGYDPDLPVLHNLNIEAKPDETIALVGPTGAGKSSTINLLCRFYDVQSGTVTVDDINVRDVTLESLRKNLGIVLQDTFIFSGTVRDNIRYGRLNATPEEVEEAAKTVGAHDFIMRLPDGYDTQVRERGSRLSVGQRQLLAFARALLADPKILILDEATSSVDAYTELLIQRALAKLFKGRTSIVIAHRLSTIRNADRIYVINNGVVIESGNHDQLIQLGGMYKDLYEKQLHVPIPGQEEDQREC